MLDREVAELQAARGASCPYGQVTDSCWMTFPECVIVIVSLGWTRCDLRNGRTSSSGSKTSTSGIHEVIVSEVLKNLDVLSLAEQEAESSHQKLTQTNALTKVSKEQDVKYQMRRKCHFDEGVRLVHQRPGFRKRPLGCCDPVPCEVERHVHHQGREVWGEYPVGELLRSPV